MPRDDFVIAQNEAGRVPVLTLPKGAVIARDGVYDLKMEVYHSDCCVGPSISSGGLRTVSKKTLRHYWAKSYLNELALDEEDADEVKETKAMRLGKAVHTLCLEPEIYHATYKVRPGCFKTFGSNDAKAWKQEQIDAGFSVITPEEQQKTARIADALRKHPYVVDGILDGDIERSMVWRDEKSGLWLKSRPDAIPTGSNMLIDLKVTTDASLEACEKKTFAMGYDLQMALAGIGMKNLLNREVEDYALLYIEDKWPHVIRSVVIGEDDILRARCLLRDAATRVAEALKTENWPGYEVEDAKFVHRRRWEAEQIDNLIKAGSLPSDF